MELAILTSILALTCYSLVAGLVYESLEVHRDIAQGYYRSAMLKRAVALFWPIGVPLVIFYAIIFREE